MNRGGARRSPRQSGMKGCKTPEREIRVLVFFPPSSLFIYLLFLSLTKAKDGHMLRTKPGTAA